MSEAEDERAEPLHRELLESARHFATDGRAEAAVIFAQMAAEMITEAAVSHWSGEENVEWIVELVEKLIPNYNPGNARVRKIVDRIVDVELGSEPWWQDFMKHVERPNSIVHRGATCDSNDAQHSISSVDQLIKCLEPKLSEFAWQKYGDL